MSERLPDWTDPTWLRDVEFRDRSTDDLPVHIGESLWINGQDTAKVEWTAPDGEKRVGISTSSDGAEVTSSLSSATVLTLVVLESDVIQPTGPPGEGTYGWIGPWRLCHPPVKEGGWPILDIDGDRRWVQVETYARTITFRRVMLVDGTIT